MLRFFKQPMVQFLLLGAMLFLVYGLIKKTDTNNLDGNLIVVDRDALLTFLQFRSASFNEGFYSRQLDSMDAEQRQQLINEYIREETLYREALALGLERNDYVIKRRLVQKLEFLTQGFLPAQEISTEAVELYFQIHQEDYRILPHMTFTHVFYDSAKHTTAQITRQAQETLEELNQGRVAFDQAVQYGDRFPYHTNYVERDLAYIASHFGATMAQQLFDLEVTDTWQGPLQSEHGLHLVLVTDKVKGRIPNLAEIYDRVKQDAQQASLQELTEQAINEIITTYEIELRLDDIQ